MGTTLHAIVEEYVPPWTSEADPTLKGGDVWLPCGSWDFGKNYDLSLWLYDRALRGWPDDSYSLRSSRFEFCDDGRQWCELPMLKRALAAMQDARHKEKTDDDDEVPTWIPHRLEALIAALDVMIGHGSTVRVLWYRG